MRHRTPIVASFVVVGMVLSFAPAARAGWLDDVRSRVSDVVASAVERGAAAASATAALGARALPYASPLNVMAAVPYVESAIVTGAGAARDAAVATGSAVADAAVAGANTLAPVVVPAAEAVADGAVTVAETVVDGTIAATRAAAGVAVTVGRTIAPVVVPAAEVLADAAVTVAETVAHGTVAAAEAAAGVAVTVGRTLEPVVVPAAVAVADFSITVEETVADGTVAAAEATAGVAVTVGRTLEPVVVPAAVATADAAAVAGSAIAGTAVDAGEAVYDAGEVVVETVADGTTALALRLRDPLLDVGTAAWEAHPEGTRRGTLRFLELAGDGAEATADAGVAAATCAWDNRKLVLDVGIVGVCLYTTGGAGSLWCVALGAAVRGAESAVTQLVEDGDVSWSTTVLDAADGGLAGLAGMAGARLVGKGAWGEWLRLFGTAAGIEVGSELVENAANGESTGIADVAERLGSTALFTAVAKAGHVAWAFGRNLYDNLAAGASLGRAARLAWEGTGGATGFLGTDRLRRRAVTRAWRNERAAVLEGRCGVSRCWAPDERAELISTGRVRGYDGHHLTSVAADPGLAANPCNIRMVDPGTHLELHGGDFQHRTWGALVPGCVP